MSTNRSVLRTKKAIRQAFIELLSEKQTIEKITIIELTEKANIVRSTFYSHYEDIYSVAKEIQNEIVSSIQEILQEYSESGLNDLSVPLTKMIEFFLKHEMEFRKLFISGYNENQFLLNLKDIVAKELFEKLNLSQIDTFNNDKVFEARFYSHIMIDMVCDYLRGTVKGDLYEMRAFIINLIQKLD